MADKVVPLPPRDPRAVNHQQWVSLAAGQMGSGDYWQLLQERQGRKLMLRVGVPHETDEGKIVWKMGIPMVPAEAQGLAINLQLALQHVEATTMQALTGLAVSAGVMRVAQPLPVKVEEPAPAADDAPADDGGSTG